MGVFRQHEIQSSSNSAEIGLGNKSGKEGTQRVEQHSLGEEENGM